MRKSVFGWLVVMAALAYGQAAVAGTDVFFNPLTQSAAVASPNHINELSSPWQVPAGLTQENLLSLQEIEADATQSIIRVPAARSSSMFDMIAYDPTGNFLFIPHETPFGAGVSRHDIANRMTVVLFQGDLGGMMEPPVWANDFGAFDPSRFTPNGTLFLGEEWTAEGRIMEVMNPMAAPADIQVRELESIANVAHEGINFSKQFNNVIYYIDEWNSGSIYKFVMTTLGDYTAGQTFILAVTAFNGNAANLWNDASNMGAVRTGPGTWVPITDAAGVPSTPTSPFRNGPTNDPRINTDTRGGRVAADEAGGTPYGRPEDMVVSTLANGNEVLYIAVTSEATIYAIEILDDTNVNAGILANADTPKNVGFPVTTGVLNSPDNLALQDNGNVYIIEDSPNNSDVGGDIWFVRDVDNDGVAESLDHFMSLQVDGSESTGMIFNPARPSEFVVAVQHPDSTDLAVIPEGFGDAVWLFDLANIVPPPAPTP